VKVIHTPNDIPLVQNLSQHLAQIGWRTTSSNRIGSVMKPQ
jgi:hypothetical protein